MKIIDLSHVINNETPIYPGDYRTAISQRTCIEKDSFNSFLLQSCMHTGTHVDMPMHFLDDKRMAAEFPIDGFMGRGVRLDVRGEAVISMKPEYRDMDLNGSVVLLYTGFDKYYFEGKYFTGHPVVSDELGAFLLSRNIKMLGMDMCGPDYSPFKLHKDLLARGVFILENLTNLKGLVGEFEVMALPLRIAAEASLVRAVAFCA
jgi:kynurenine formamidase